MAHLGYTRPVVLVFVDGFGWGCADPAVNPCHAYGGRLFQLPEIDGHPAAESLPVWAGGFARPVDAVLGVPGVPQSATGQTTLLTGINAQAICGQHLTGFPNNPLREILLDHSILKTATDQGLKAAFLNAYRPLFFRLPRSVQLRLSATTVANLAADLPFFTMDDIKARRAIYQEFTNCELRGRGFDVPLFTPAEAGTILARRAQQYDFVLFEYFQTDRAGHAQEWSRACEELRKLEDFLLSLLAGLGLIEDAQSTAERGKGSGDTCNGDEACGEHQPMLIVTSDHGNLEDLSTKRHTSNPVPLMAWGADAIPFLSRMEQLSEVAGAIMKTLLPSPKVDETHP